MKTVLLLVGLLASSITWADVTAKTVNQKIKEQNAGWVAKDTWISKLSKVERKQLLGLSKPPAREVQFTAKRALKTHDALPAVVDWRDINGQNWVTPILNQANCGSCVAFATIATLETQVRIASGDPNYNVKLSPQNLFSCGGGSCDWGWYPDAAVDYLQQTGVVDEACAPYTSGATGTDMQCSIACPDADQRRVKIASYASPTGMNHDADSVKQALQHGPLITTLNVYADFMTYSSGVYKHVTGSYEGGHAVSIVGYDDSQGAFIIRNSWGTDWGQGGFAYISYDDVSGVGDSTWSMDVPAMSGAVSVANPIDYSYYTGNMDFKVTSSFPGTDSVAVTFFNDQSQAVWSTNCSADCAQTADVSSLADGRYEIAAIAMDAHGQPLGTSEHHVFYIANQTPQLSLSFSGDGFDMSRPVRSRIVFDVTDSSSTVPMSSLEFHYKSADGSETARVAQVVLPSMTTGWRTELVPNGSYEVWMVGHVKTNAMDTTVESQHVTLQVKN